MSDTNIDEFPSHESKHTLYLQAQQSCCSLFRSNPTGYWEEHFQDWYNTILTMDSSNSLVGLRRRRLNLEHSSMGGRLQGLLYSYTLPLQSQECPYSLSTQLQVLYFSNKKAFFPILELLKRVHQCGSTNSSWSTCYSHFCNAYSWFGSLNANYKLLVCRRLTRLFLILTLHRR